MIPKTLYLSVLSFLYLFAGILDGFTHSYIYISFENKLLS